MNKILSKVIFLVSSLLIWGALFAELPVYPVNFFSHPIKDIRGDDIFIASRTNSKSNNESANGYSTTSLFDLGGFVFLDKTNASHCKVYLILYDSLNASYHIIDTTDVDDKSGFYLFTDLNPAKYFLKAALDTFSPVYHNYLPTYFGNDFFWQHAQVIDLKSNGYLYDISMTLRDTAKGNGNISGMVVKNTNPIECIQMVLVTDQGKPVNYCYTLNDGKFSFPNLPYNTYRIYTELLGIRTYSGKIVLNVNHPNYQHIIIELASGVNENPVLSSITAINPRPNPFRNEITIAFFLPEPMDYNIQLFDLTGRQLQNYTTVGHKGENEITLYLNEYDSGIYLIKMLMNGYVPANFKIIKTF